MQLHWSHAFVHVDDMDTMLDFYTGVLGFEVTDQGAIGDTRVTFMSQVETDHHQLAFLERAAPRETRAPGNVGHFAFRAQSLDEVKALHRRLQEDERIKGVNPVTHGNAWSVYFADPEGNGIEVFCDTPWHTRQPAGGTWDPAQSDDDIRQSTRQAFENEDGFGPIEDFYRSRAEHLAEREGRAQPSQPD